MAKKLSYRDAGLDLDLYNETMASIAPMLRRTFSSQVIEQRNGFAGLFSLDSPHKLFQKKYRRPVLVSGTDGVGTKLKVAGMAQVHDTVGIDLVAMCANDCLCTGAELLFFLDYIAMGRDDPKLTKQLVEGIAAGCQLAECSLIAGETAIMPDLYRSGDYDMAGFCVGVVEQSRLINGLNCRPGDLLIGIPSSGLHSNGYSLVRQIVFRTAKLKIGSQVAELGRSVGEELLEPTRIYVRPVTRILKRYRVKRAVRAIAHITGGGIVENLPRVLPADCDAMVRKSQWNRPPVFPWLQGLGDVDDQEMWRVFNMGIGMVLVVGHYYADAILRELAHAGFPSSVIGEITKGERKVVVS